MNTFAADLPTDAGLDALGAPRWRELLLVGLVRSGAILGLVPALLSVMRALDSGNWWPPTIALGALAALAGLTCAPVLGYRLRVWLLLAVIYGIGLGLLLRVGPATTIYLLACPLVAGLLLGRRAALALVGLTSLTLTGAGWALNLELDIPGMESQAATKWLNHGANFAFVGLVLTLSGSYLLQGLESALARQREATDSLRHSEENLRQIAAQVPGMVYRLRLGQGGRPRFLYVSPGAQGLLGLTPSELMANGHRLMHLVHPGDRPQVVAELTRAYAESRGFTIEFRVCLANDGERWIHASSSEVARDETGVVHNGIMVDITERKTAEARLWHQAHYDALTELPNRELLRERLRQIMARSAEGPRPFALLLVDLDHFKEVNDTLGHDRGDLLLAETARRISHGMPADAVVARMGGDEFAVVLQAPEKPELADQVAQRILDLVSSPFTLGLERVYVSASIGIVLFPDDADGLEELLKHADQALYEAKDAGRKRFRRFTRRLQEDAQNRMRLASDLRGVLAARQLHLVYQPIVDMDTGRVRKAEALLRWTHQERGPVSPAEFIPIAEATGLIVEIGEWVFHTAAAQVLEWRHRLDPEFQISVNRSPAQFRTDGSNIETWQEHLARRGLPGDAIVVEITEGLLLDSAPEVTEQMHKLRAGGLPISLDDFGTGYSAMAYLQRFEIDYLKIDRRFVSGMQRDETGQALCRAIIVMAHELGMKVIAEGVETGEQHRWLKAAGCDHGQGYRYARPMPPEAFERWMAQRTLALSVDGLADDAEQAVAAQV